MELGPGELGCLAVLGAEDDRRPVAAFAQQVLGHVEARIRQEPGFPQLLSLDEEPFAAVADDTTELPHRGPELAGMLRRPAMERCVRVHLDAVPIIDRSNRRRLEAVTRSDDGDHIC